MLVTLKNFSKTISKPNTNRVNFDLLKTNTITFTSNIDQDKFVPRNKFSIGSLPAELIGVDISKIDKNDKNVLEINETGYFSEVIKYKNPKTKRTFAIKRNWASDKAKHNLSNPNEQMKNEVNIYKKLYDVHNIPQFYYYSADFLKNQKSTLNNYIVMSWVEGKPSSKNGVHYDLDLINSDKLLKLFKTFEKLENKGVIHNDLWAGNILFTNKDVNLIDFNRSFEFNPITQYKLNNMESFEQRFLDRYFADLYDAKNEKEFLETFKNTLKIKRKYYKAKEKFYKKHNNTKAVNYYKSFEQDINKNLKFHSIMRNNAIKTVFNSNIHCGNVMAKHFEFESEESQFHYQRALNLLEKNPNITDFSTKNLIKTNLYVTTKLGEFINLKKKPTKDEFEGLMKVLQDKRIYGESEQKKDYYVALKKFCEFNVKALGSEKDDLANLKEEYFDIVNIKRLKPFFIETYGK